MKIEIEKPVIPQFVADWIDSFYDEGGSKYDVIGSIFVYSSKYDKIVHDWYVDNKDAFITAVMYGYDIQKEPLCYAKIKGWELTTNGNVFWNYRSTIFNPLFSRVYVDDKEDEELVKTKMTKEEWKSLGINDTNADFEEAE